MAPRFPGAPFLNPKEICEVTLFFLKFIPWIIDEFEEHSVHHFWMNKGEFATPKWSQSTNEGIAFSFQLIHGCFSTIHIQPDDHDAFAPFLNKFGYVTIRGGGFHQFKSNFSQPVARHPDFLGFIHIGIIRSFSKNGFPDFLCRLKVLDCNTDVINLIYLHQTPPLFLSSFPEYFFISFGHVYSLTNVHKAPWTHGSLSIFLKDA